MGERKSVGYLDRHLKSPRMVCRSELGPTVGTVRWSVTELVRLVTQRYRLLTSMASSVQGTGQASRRWLGRGNIDRSVETAIIEPMLRRVEKTE